MITLDTGRNTKSMQTSCLRLYTDAVAIRRILNNILDNAF